MSKGIYREEVRIFKNCKDIGENHIFAYDNMFTYPITSDWHYGEIPNPVTTRPYCAMELFGLNVNHRNFAEHNVYVDKYEQLKNSLGIRLEYGTTVPSIFSSSKYYALFTKYGRVYFKLYDIFEFEKNIQIKDSNKITVQDAMELLSAKDFYQFMYDNDPCNGHSKLIGFGGLF